jgi:hypothetical protein
MPDRVLRVKEGVQFTVIAPGGFRILEALSCCARKLGIDLTITSACDGTHSGPTDPHHRGEAYDVRTHDMSGDLKPVILNALGALLPTSNFYAFLEAPGTANEHIHVQVRKGTQYP